MRETKLQLPLFLSILITLFISVVVLASEFDDLAEDNYSWLNDEDDQVKHGSEPPKFKEKVWDYYMGRTISVRNMNQMVAYQKGLTTWAKWVDLNLDPRKTRAIFRSMSPRHNSTARGIEKMRFPVYLQDITTISAFRRGRAPFCVQKGHGTREKQHLREFSSDCSHWCLPGVPDIWNEMLSVLL
ncbi:hypothetical protein M0R45_035905 [Rubus argutus]|uniref:Trichome birefringence-like C-terminal domain-containing protein n=1 Tax=Rubus argutus TaxID=59490 RepID=A0AAW1VVJ5_RUBAR